MFPAVINTGQQLESCPTPCSDNQARHCTGGKSALHLCAASPAVVKCGFNNDVMVVQILRIPLSHLSSFAAGYDLFNAFVHISSSYMINFVCVHQCIYCQISEGHEIPFLELSSPANAEKRRGNKILLNLVGSGSNTSKTVKIELSQKHQFL